MINPEQPDYSTTPAGGQIAYRLRASTHEPCVSIVTPFFNVPRGIFAETVHSIRNQSLQQWEWIIVDDCSTDPAGLEALEMLRAEDSRCRIIRHTRNRGLPASRNTGYREAQTPYVLQIDGDDLLEPTALEKFFWFLETHPQFGYVSSYEVDFGDAEYLNDRGFHEGVAILSENRSNPIALVRKSVFSDAGGFDETNIQGFEDWDFWLRCLTAGYLGATVPEYLKWYRRSVRQIGAWGNWDLGCNQAQFTLELTMRYRSLYQERFPTEESARRSRMGEGTPAENPLELEQPSIAIVTASLEAPKLEELVRQCCARGVFVSLCALERAPAAALARFGSQTTDLFVFEHFLHPRSFVAFLCYLVRSRESCGCILISGRPSASADSLRRAFPKLPILDSPADSLQDTERFLSEILG